MTDTLQATHMSTTTSARAIVDVRALHPRERHPLIFATLRKLDAGESFELVNDHDPNPLRAHLESDENTTYSWTVLEDGPQIWRIAIGRSSIEVAPAAKACCGCCGGGH